MPAATRFRPAITGGRLVAKGWRRGRQLKRGRCFYFNARMSSTVGQQSNDRKGKSKSGATAWDAAKRGPSVDGGLVDVAVNLSHPAFSDNPEGVLERAAEVGVGGVLAVGTSEGSSEESLRTAERCNGRGGVDCVGTAGIHPHDAKDAKEGFDRRLEEMAMRERCAAIGECGLDFNRDFSPRDVQEEVFKRQLELASRLEMPALVHCRDAHNSLIRCLKERTPSNVLVHCFTGTGEEAKQLRDMGCYVGVTGWAADDREGRKERLQEAIKEIGLGALVVETDSPFLTPRNIRPSKLRPRTNEPCLLPYVISAVAEALGESDETVARWTSSNARRFLRLGSW